MHPNFLKFKLKILKFSLKDIYQYLFKRICLTINLFFHQKINLFDELENQLIYDRCL